MWSLHLWEYKTDIIYVREKRMSCPKWKILIYIRKEMSQRRKAGRWRIDYLFPEVQCCISCPLTWIKTWSHFLRSPSQSQQYIPGIYSFCFATTNKLVQRYMLRENICTQSYNHILFPYGCIRISLYLERDLLDLFFKLQLPLPYVIIGKTYVSAILVFLVTLWWPFALLKKSNHYKSIIN